MSLTMIVTVAGLAINLLTLLGAVLIKFNDLRHLGKDVRDIKLEQKEQRIMIEQNSVDIANLKGWRDSSRGGLN